MLYDLTNIMDVQAAKTKLAGLIKRGCLVELSEKKARRSLSQNNYLHLILSYFACRSGNTLEWVKMNYYKLECNRSLFVREKWDATLQRPVGYVRSSADLTTEEMSLSIDRFKDWSAQVAEIALPDAEDAAQIAAAQVEVERNKRWI